eukprot:5198913-Amphidinium_carterae.1
MLLTIFALRVRRSEDDRPTPFGIPKATWILGTSQNLGGDSTTILGPLVDDLADHLPIAVARAGDSPSLAHEKFRFSLSQWVAHLPTA